MAGVDTGGGHGGKKSVDQEIPLVPFIDLLLCCVMFLLVTAVWNQLARINANQKAPGAPSAEMPPPEEEKVKLYLQLQAQGYVIASSAGEREVIAKVNDEYDISALKEKLDERKRNEPNRTDIIVAPEDGVMYKDVVTAMDLAVENFQDMQLSDAASISG